MPTAYYYPTSYTDPRNATNPTNGYYADGIYATFNAIYSDSCAWVTYINFSGSLPVNVRIDAIYLYCKYYTNYTGSTVANIYHYQRGQYGLPPSTTVTEFRQSLGTDFTNYVTNAQVQVSQNQPNIVLYVDCVRLEVEYTSLNSPPGTPLNLTTPGTIARGSKPLITWGTSTDTDGNLSGYKLERQYNGGAWTQIYSGALRSYTDTIGSTWNTVAYRVKAYDVAAAESAYRTGSTITVTGGVEIHPPGVSLIKYAYKAQGVKGGLLKTSIKIQTNIGGVIKTILQ